MGFEPVTWNEFGRDNKETDGFIVEESLVSLYVNGKEIASLMATPLNQDWLAAGFLKNAHLINTVDEIKILHITRAGCCVDIWLDHELQQPDRKIITSGCGGGILFEEPDQEVGRIEYDVVYSPDQLYALFDQLQQVSKIHRQAGGIHAAALSDGKELLITVEDIGRHNTVDKLCGYSLLNSLDTGGLLLLTTGRVSSEMTLKGARMGCPVIASRNSATSLSRKIAESWNITLAGYVRRRSMRVYTHPERLSNCVKAE
ncbi:MAG: formate dehydrogenase accessory sulfurtransferase FdhD [Anaerolineales bacterium]|nr:formate dehydrogenase accessory sulfurtransferase FdhD [Anaerolineales bacterium]